MFVGISNGTSSGELIYGNPELVFTATATDGVVSVVRELPESTSPGTYTETVTVEHEGSTVSLSQSTTVKSAEDSDAAKIIIVPGGGGASKPFAYSSKLALASGSDMASAAAQMTIALWTVAGVLQTIFLSFDQLSEFTEHSPNNFIETYFKEGPTITPVPGQQVLLWQSGVLVSGPPSEPPGCDDLVVVPISLSPNPGNPSQRVSFNVSAGNNAGNITDPGTGRGIFDGPGGGCGGGGDNVDNRPIFPKLAPAGFAHITLTVYNTHGQKVKTLVDEVRSFGRYTIEWDSRDEEGRHVSSGLYLYRLQVGDQIAIAKGLILR